MIHKYEMIKNIEINLAKLFVFNLKDYVKLIWKRKQSECQTS